MANNFSHFNFVDGDHLGVASDAPVHVEIDIDTMTAADIYEGMLSICTGGIEFIGFDPNPSMETVVKVAPDRVYGMRANTIRGIAEINMTQSNVRETQDAIGQDPWDVPWAGGDFYGASSREHGTNLFDSGLVSQDMSKVVSDMVSLYAMSVAGGGDPAKSLKVVEEAARVELNDISEVPQLLPSSFEKRALIPEGSKNHSLFGMGTIQKAIKADMADYTTSKLGHDAAADWSRLTTIARYLAGINTIFDRKVREYAMKQPLPITLGVVKGAYPRILKTDFVIDYMADITRSDLKRPYMFESDRLLGLIFVQGADRIASAKAKLEKEGLKEDAFIENVLREMAKTRFLASKPKPPVIRQLEPTIAPLVTVRNRDESMAAYTKAATASAYSAYKETIGRFFKTDTKFADGVRRVVMDRQVHASYESWRDVPRMIKYSVIRMHSADFVVTAINILNDKLKDKKLATHRVLEYFRQLTETSYSDLSTSINSDSVYRNTYRKMLPLMITAHWSQGKPSSTLNLSEPISADLGRSVLTVLKNFVKDSSTKWAARYEENALAYLRSRPGDKKVVLYQGAAQAMRCATPEGLLNATGGYAIVRDSKNNYLIAMASAYARKRNLPLVIKKLKDMSSMYELAQHIDETLKPNITFKEVEEFARSRLKYLSEDIMAAGNVVEPRDGKDIPDYVQMADFGSQNLALFAALDELNEAYEEDKLEAVIASYPSTSLYEKYVAMLNLDPEVIRANPADHMFDTLSETIKERLCPREEVDDSTENYTLIA